MKNYFVVSVAKDVVKAEVHGANCVVWILVLPSFC